MRLSLVLAAAFAVGCALPAAAQQIVVAPTPAPATPRACVVTVQRPDTAKLLTIGPNGNVATTELGGGDAWSTTSVCDR